jgi:hypothetical protein
MAAAGQRHRRHIGGRMRCPENQLLRDALSGRNRSTIECMEM